MTHECQIDGRTDVLVANAARNYFVQPKRLSMTLLVRGYAVLVITVVTDVSLTWSVTVILSYTD